VSSATTFGVEDLMKLHRGFVQRGEGKRLGRLIKIVLGDVPAGVPLNISPKELSREGRTLDWFDQGPIVSLSPGDIDLLVTTPVLPLPDKPDPDFVAPVSTQEEIEAATEWRAPKAPLVRQIPEDRGARRMRGTNTLLFEPVYQVLFRLIGVSGFGWIQAIADPASPTVLTFVWDFDRSEGFFYGGRFTVNL